MKALFLLFVFSTTVYGEKRVHMLHWYRNATTLAERNEFFPDVLYKESDVLGFRCMIPSLSDIYLVREGHDGKCPRVEGDPTAHCYSRDIPAVVDLQSYEAGPYFAISYDDWDGKPYDDICGHGTSFPVNIVDGMDPYLLWPPSKETNHSVQALVQLEEGGVKKVNHRFEESHSDEDDAMIADLEKIDDDQWMQTSSPPPITVPSHKLLIVSVPLLLVLLICAIGCIMWKRNTAPAAFPVLYTNLINELPLQDLNPV